MNRELAKKTLIAHSGNLEDGPEDGFLNILRPYQGLRASNFHDVMESILSLGTELASQASVDREIVEAIWGLCYYARKWGTEEDGMLVRNKLISPSDRLLLENWIDCIETTTLALLAGNQPHECISNYCQYINEHGWGKNYDFFIPYLERAITEIEFADCLPIHLESISRLGDAGLPLLAALQAAALRNYAWYEPVEKCTLEMRARVQETIKRIQADATTQNIHRSNE